VLVRRLAAIEDLGAIDVLCTDKTGTLTQGVMALAEAGRQRGLDVGGLAKVDEIPYDFRRRCLTIVVADPAEPGRHRIVTKGAVANVLDACSHVATAGGGEQPLDAAARERVQAWLHARGEQGLRVLAVATREVEPRAGAYTAADERGLRLAGFVTFTDPPKPSAVAAVHGLRRRGVVVKMITGDNRHVAAHVARTVGLDSDGMLSGEQIAALGDEALWHLASRCDLFAEVDPMQK
jgi:Mg2+-importing ATPase